MAIDPSIVQAAVSRVEGCAVGERLRAVRVRQGQTATVLWPPQDVSGQAVDLSYFGIDTGSANPRVPVRIREALSWSPGNPGVQLDADVGEDGTVSFKLPLDAVAFAGISIAEIGFLGADDGLLFSNSFYLIVDRGQFGLEVRDTGPPTVQEIRLKLRDSGPADNFALTTLEFDDAEVADAVVQTVRYWNEAQPPIRQRFNTATFPFPLESLEGVKALLYRLAAAHYRREDVVYSAAGVSFDDKRKAPEYEQIAAQLWDSYGKWVRRKKASLNMQGAFGSVASPYGGIVRWWP